MIYRGRPSRRILEKIYHEIKEVAVKSGKIVFVIDKSNSVTTEEKIIKPLLSETMVLVKNVKDVKIVAEGKIVDNIEDSYLNREVSNMYSDFADVLFIEIE